MHFLWPHITDISITCTTIDFRYPWWCKMWGHKDGITAVQVIIMSVMYNWWILHLLFSSSAYSVIPTYLARWGGWQQAQACGQTMLATPLEQPIPNLKQIETYHCSDITVIPFSSPISSSISYHKYSNNQLFHMVATFLLRSCTIPTLGLHYLPIVGGTYNYCLVSW